MSWCKGERYWVCAPDTGLEEAGREGGWHTLRKALGRLWGTGVTRMEPWGVNGLLRWKGCSRERQGGKGQGVLLESVSAGTGTPCPVDWTARVPKAMLRPRLFCIAVAPPSLSIWTHPPQVHPVPPSPWRPASVQPALWSSPSNSTDTLESFLLSTLPDSMSRAPCVLSHVCHLATWGKHDNHPILQRRKPRFGEGPVCHVAKLST